MPKAVSRAALVLALVVLLIPAAAVAQGFASRERLTAERDSVDGAIAEYDQLIRRAAAGEVIVAVPVDSLTGAPGRGAFSERGPGDAFGSFPIFVTMTRDQLYRKAGAWAVALQRRGMSRQQAIERSVGVTRAVLARSAQMAREIEQALGDAVAQRQAIDRGLAQFAPPRAAPPPPAVPGPQPGGWMTGLFTTTYGMMRFSPGGGTYERPPGSTLRVTGVNGNEVEGYWSQGQSGQRCPGGDFSGRFHFVFNATGFTGTWGYCGSVTDGGSWNGTRTDNP